MKKALVFAVLALGSLAYANGDDPCAGKRVKIDASGHATCPAMTAAEIADLPTGGTQGPAGPAGPQGPQGEVGPAGPDPLAGLHPVLLFKTACPTGWTELAEADGFFLLFTKAADGDAGTTVVSSVALTAAAQTFTGDPTTVPALAAGTLAHAHTHTFTASSNASSPKLMTANTSSGVAASGTTGAASSTAITGSTATGSLTPLGHNTASAVTGTVTPPAYKLIPCEKN